MRVFKFKDGSELQAKLVATTSCIYIVKSESGNYFIINRFNLVDEEDRM